jgi:hypothetical protein
MLHLASLTCLKIINLAQTACQDYLSKGINVQEKHFIIMTPCLGQMQMDVILGRLQIPSFDHVGCFQLHLRCIQ